MWGSKAWLGSVGDEGIIIRGIGVLEGQGVGV